MGKRGQTSTLWIPSLGPRSDLSCSGCLSLWEMRAKALMTSPSLPGPGWGAGGGTSL